MYKTYQDIEVLKQLVEEDKLSVGVNASTLNRYPIRFVLFDNFRECYEFVYYLQNDRGVYVESVDRWIDNKYPDLMITPLELAEHIERFINEKSPKDCVIAPFSELARFYDNEEHHSFDALIKTIKAIEAKPLAVEKHQRVYIPIVGLEGKMESFKNDSQIIIWRLISENKDLVYKLILTKGTDYAVKGLGASHTIVENMREWLNIWNDPKKQITPHIICKSKAIFANAFHAQPDNAFSYQMCENAYDFLIYGLNLSFGGIQPQISDKDNWETLAQSIDLSKGFNFISFVRDYFGVSSIENYQDFIQLWFSHPGSFDRWLLARYFSNKLNDRGYICELLRDTSDYGTNEFIERMVAKISEYTTDMQMRRYCLQYAAKQHIHLSEAAENLWLKTLNNLPDQIGYASSLQYLTGISTKEKDVIVDWYGKGKISANDLKNAYPDLYHYVKEGVGVAAGIPQWVETYFTEYKRAKLSNRYTEAIEQQINEKNASEASFDLWYNQFSTTYTQLMNRGDIEVFYWVDGLGVDWIPLVKQIVAEKKDQQIYLNEIKVVRAKLPTKTDINKLDLQRLLPEGATLEKEGDLDALAHRTDNIHPFTINKEIGLVRKTIEGILNKYIGKKIAIVSDHGLTYLSQMVSGLNLGGVDSDHHGRVAIRKKTDTSSDSSYFRLEDNKTLCALKHESLCAKVPSGQGIHGGCTPEEVLVPIFVISSTPAPTNWSAQLLTMELNGANPTIRFNIKNLPSTDIPYIEYNNVRYGVHNIGGDVYESDAIAVDTTVKQVSLVIGAVIRSFNIMISAGVDEVDLFS